MEYRIIDIEINGVVIETNPFDFGCTAIVQDNLKAMEVDKSLQDNLGKFTVNLVETVLYRMLEGKLKNFSLVKTIQPEVIMSLFLQFQKWYKEDIDYLNRLMSDVTVKGIKLGDESTGENTDSLYYIMYMLFKSHNLEPRVIKSWKFEDVAEILYFSERERVAQYLKDNPLI